MIAITPEMVLIDPDYYMVFIAMLKMHYSDPTYYYLLN